MFQSKMNYKNKYKDDLKCDSCLTMQDENIHVLYCDAYRELRIGKNLQSDKDLGQYLQKVLLIRSRLELNR